MAATTGGIAVIGGIFTLVGVALGGGIAARSSGRATREAAASQRELAQDARQQDRLARTYVTLADWVVRVEEMARALFPGLPDEEVDALVANVPDDARRELRAQISLFGSAEVRGLVDQAFTERIRLRSAFEAHREALRTSDWPQDERQEILHDYREARNRLLDTCDALLTRIRIELGTERP